MIQDPVQPTPTPPTRRRAPLSPAAQAGLVFAFFLALFLPVLLVLAARSSEEAPVAAGASAAPLASAGTGQSQGKGNGPKDKADKDDKDDKAPKDVTGNGAQGEGPITIREIDGSSITVTTDDDWTRTIVATSATVITKGGQTIAVNDLRVGDTIRFHQVRNADGSYTVDAITVPTPTASGEVTAVDATTITVSKRGATRVITVTGSTVYTIGDSPGTKADVTVGAEIEAHGTVSGNDFTATAIEIEPARVKDRKPDKGAASPSPAPS